MMSSPVIAKPSPASSDRLWLHEYIKQILVHLFVLTWLKSSSMEPESWASIFLKIPEEENGLNVSFWHILKLCHVSLSS